MNTGGAPRPVAGVARAGGAQPAGWLQTSASARSWRALLDLAPARAGAGITWREGDLVSARVVARAAGEAVLQLGRTMLAAKTELPLPVGAQAQFVVRRLQGNRAELQLVALKTVSGATAGETAPANAVHAQPVHAGAAWQLAFVLPDGGEATVSGVAVDEWTGEDRPADAEEGERLVIRWQSEHLGEVEIDLDVGAAAGDGKRPARLAARAGASAAAAVRSGLPALTSRLEAVGLAVKTRTVTPLRRKGRQAPALRLDTRL